MLAGMDSDDLEQQYQSLVRRIGGYPMTEAVRARILAEVEAIYRRERAELEAAITTNWPRNS